ncbi:hypothetical protein ACHAQJ_000318 [Trichoderma viride]
MDPFNTIPSSVLATIAKNVPDLASLHSLRLASPACAALFMNQGQGYKIVETVAEACLDINSQTIFGYIWKLLQQPVAARSTILECPPQGSASYISFWFTDSLPTIESTLQMLILANIVYCAAHRCLHTLLQRFIDLRPRRPHWASFHFFLTRFWIYAPNSPFQPPPQPPTQLAGIDLNAATAPLEWFEEQRALYGAWQLALYTVVRERPKMNLWPPNNSEVAHLKAMNVEGAWALEDLPQTLLDKSTISASPSQHRRLSDVFPWAPSCGESGCSVKPIEQPADEDLKALFRGQIFLDQVRAPSWSPLRAASSGPFRVLGFNIWGESRFIAMGLLTSEHDMERQLAKNNRPDHCDMSTWRSVLTPSQLEALEAAQYAIWKRWQQETANASD